MSASQTKERNSTIGTRQIIATFDLFSVLVVLLSPTRVSTTACCGKMRTTQRLSSCSLPTPHIHRHTARILRVVVLMKFFVFLRSAFFCFSFSLSLSHSHSLPLFLLFPQALTLTEKQVLPIPLACLYYVFFSIFFDRSHPTIR
jgi:hypothetical protein